MKKFIKNFSQKFIKKLDLLEDLNELKEFQTLFQFPFQLYHD